MKFDSQGSSSKFRPRSEKAGGGPSCRAGASDSEECALDAAALSCVSVVCEFVLAQHFQIWIKRSVGRLGDDLWLGSGPVLGTS